MKISMYQASVPVFVRMQKNLIAILQKAAAHAEAKKIDPLVLTGSRLFPDMFALTRQVQTVSDNAKGGASRLAGVEPPKYEDNENGFADLIARLQKTIAYLESLKPEQFDGAEDRTVKLQTRRGELVFQGTPYLLNFLMPNFYFHVATTYNILRHNGVELGKTDFLGSA